MTAVWILIGVLIAGKRGQGDACEICVWKAQIEQKDLVIFLKSSVTTSYDLLRGKAGLRRWPWRGAVGGALSLAKVEEGGWYLRVAVELIYIASWKSGSVHKSFPLVVKGV